MSLFTAAPRASLGVPVAARSPESGGPLAPLDFDDYFQDSPGRVTKRLEAKLAEIHTDLEALARPSSPRFSSESSKSRVPLPPRSLTELRILSPLPLENGSDPRVKTRGVPYEANPREPAQHACERRQPKRRGVRSLRRLLSLQPASPKRFDQDSGHKEEELLGKKREGGRELRWSRRVSRNVRHLCDRLLP